MSGILMANSNQIKYVKEMGRSEFELDGPCEQIISEHKKRLELLEMHADHTETLLN